MFTQAFEKTAEDKDAGKELVDKAWLKRREDREQEAWRAVENVLSALPKTEKAKDFRPGEYVFFQGETGWKTGDDARHTKGVEGVEEFPDWDKDGIANGERGVVTAVEGDRIRVRWDKHFYAPHSKMWTFGNYRANELKKDPRKLSDWQIDQIEEKLNPQVEKVAVSRDWIRKHMLNGINKRFAMSRGMNHPKATAKAYTEKVLSHPTKEVVHQVAELVKKRKAIKNVY